MNNTLNQIAEIIAHHQQPYSDCGLLGGRMGELLFLYNYSRIDETYKPKADELLEQIIACISTDTLYMHTYCSGLAGFGVGIHLLEEAGFIEGSADLLDDVDSLLDSRLTMEIGNSHYDFLHGAIGIGFYFLKHYQQNPSGSLVQLEKLLKYLEEAAIIDRQKNELKWKAPDLYKGRGKLAPHADFNISLSHGMSSILIFLSRLIDLRLMDNKRNVELLTMAVNYVLAQRMDHRVYGCYFPHSSIESLTELKRSRLAWCYGDLGVAVALWQAGCALQRTDLKELSVEVLTHAASRKDLVENYVCDAGLCHGSSGIAQLFFRMNLVTGVPALHEAYAYWRDVTLRLAYHEDGLAGYKAFMGEEGWRNEYSLLEGISGIGLSLLSPVNSDWDEVLLINFK